MSHHVLITGASSGFGEALVEAFAAAGWNVTATMRNLTKLPDHFPSLPNVQVALLDVTDDASIGEAVAASRERFGEIDVLVNAAGYTQVGTLEELSMEEIRRVFEANFFGLLAVTKAVLPQMRERGSGHVINFSSLAGIVGLPVVSSYTASKWAVEGMSEALARDVAHLGISVTIVEPGLFATGLGASAGRPASPIDAYYAPDAAINRSWYDGTLGSVAAAAEAIVSVAGTERPPLRLYVGHGLDDARRNVAQRLEEWGTWESLTRSTLG